MERTVTALVPIRSFDGMTRLSGRLRPEDRTMLARDLAGRTTRAALDADAAVSVITADPEVKQWATTCGLDVVDEAVSRGLNGAAATGVEAVGDTPWLVIHSDLPAISADDIRAATEAVKAGYVLAPSHDGGTSIVGGTGPNFPFRYGPGSFRRHLSAVHGEAMILVRPGLALDLDHPWDLEVLGRLGYFETGTEHWVLGTE